MSEELKPCPFCGGEVEISTYRNEGYQIECPNHEWTEREMWLGKRPESDIAADVGMFTWGISDEAKAALIEAWNTRTPEQAIAATLGRPKAKSHPYGYERDTGAYDCTRCECGCINDISATYCNDCGGEIEIDESAGKEYYDGHGKHTVLAKKHDDGSLEFCERRYVPEDAATLGGGNLTAEQVREAIEENSWAETSTIREFNDSSWRAIADELNAKLGGGECELAYGENDDGVDGWYTQCGGWFAATRKDGRMVHPLFCQLCGSKVVKR